jgi:hypothetical protein
LAAVTESRLKKPVLTGFWNLSALVGIDLAELITRPAQQKADAMHLGYVQPFRFQLNPRPEPGISSVRHGVTEITLSDGRLVRATLHVKSVKTDPNRPGAIDVSYNVIAELMARPQSPILDIHETVQ